jgi:hypothetical protein
VNGRGRSARTGPGYDVRLDGVQLGRGPGGRPRPPARAHR